ncbi:MAG TPA: hypothetical protein VML19_07130 [Verrucomicrobiae bacterium]|nr:hypothetical protein [Verrucomicrobiae bacterium]
MDLNLVNRSAIWYLQELEATEDRGDLTTTGALYLLYQDRLVREKTRNAIKTGCDCWIRSCRQQAAHRHRLAAAGRWTEWMRLVFLTSAIRSCIFWLHYGPPVGQRAALRRIAEASLRVAHLCNQ